jgi:hypothetical protein
MNWHDKTVYRWRDHDYRTIDALHRALRALWPGCLLSFERDAMRVRINVREEGDQILVFPRGFDDAGNSIIARDWIEPPTKVEPPEPTPEEVAHLRAYAKRNGRSWKQALRNDWRNAVAPPVLQRLRNTHGPRWLESYKLPAEERANA